VRIYILGDYLNAISLYKSIEKLIGEREREVIAFNTSGRNLIGRLFKNIETIDLLENPIERFQEYIESQPCRESVLLLTNEMLHSELYRNRKYYESKGLNFHIGSKDPSLLMDKTNFLKEVDRVAHGRTPLNYLPSAEMKFPVFVKAKSSFVNGIKIRKKIILKTKVDYHNFLDFLEVNQFDKNDFVYQELLSTKAEDNISIAGWKEKGSDRLLAFQSCKLLQHPPKMGTGDVTKIMDIDDELYDLTVLICKHFNYHGPFELEFVLSTNGVAKVLEFNPRFWMQHGLINAISGESLTALALGIDPLPKNEEKDHWLNPLYVLPKSMTGNCAYLKQLFNSSTFWPITFTETLRLLPTVIRNR